MNRQLRWIGAPLVGATLGVGSIISAAAATAPTGTSAYAPVALSQATVARSTFYVSPAASPLSAGSASFTLSNAYWMHYGDAPASLTMDYAKPQAVSLLINSSYTDAAFAGQTVGTVHLTFSDGTSQDTALIVGNNIREWEFGVDWTAHTLSSASAVSIWQGQAQAAQGGAMATMDMLTIPVTSAAHLKSVTVTDTNNSHMGIVFQGLTVKYNPAPTRPGNSGNTPAADRSQAPNHSNSENFTGVKPAATLAAAVSAAMTSAATAEKDDDTTSAKDENKSDDADKSDTTHKTSADR